MTTCAPWLDDNLTMEEKLILIERYKHGKSDREVAERLGWRRERVTIRRLDVEARLQKEARRLLALRLGAGPDPGRDVEIGRLLAEGESEIEFRISQLLSLPTCL